jgi:hypothetical protein
MLLLISREKPPSLSFFFYPLRRRRRENSGARPNLHDHQHRRPANGGIPWRNALVAQYPVSTSRYGVGDRSQSYETPLGIFTVAARIGEGAPEGAVFKGRRMTGEVISPNAPGRDAIVTRILQLRGLTSGAAHAYDRGIYIHGTPAESQLGRPASYGCIRMRSRDIVRVFEEAPVGTKIAIIKTPIARVLARAALVRAHRARPRPGGELGNDETSEPFGRGAVSTSSRPRACRKAGGRRWQGESDASRKRGASRIVIRHSGFVIPPLLTGCQPAANGAPIPRAR